MLINSFVLGEEGSGDIIVRVVWWTGVAERRGERGKERRKEEEAAGGVGVGGVVGVT